MPTALEDEMHRETNGSVREQRAATTGAWRHRPTSSRPGSRRPDACIRAARSRLRRLELMLNSILARLVGESPAGGVD